MKNIAEFTIDPHIAWEPNGTDEFPFANLNAWVRILGADFHAQAIQVNEDGDAVDDHFQSDIDALRDINVSYGEPFYTVQISERLYVVFFYPFAN
jgi:hypothetical protein